MVMTLVKAIAIKFTLLYFFRKEGDHKSFHVLCRVESGGGLAPYFVNRS
jgi:hypothetical protein